MLRTLSDRGGSGNGDIGIAAERADCPVMNWNAAIRATLLKNLAAQRAVFPMSRIRNRSIWIEQRPSADLVGPIGRALRIRTESARSRQ